VFGIVLAFGAGLLFSARFLSVPLDSRVYQILDNAVAQGAISQVPNIRPYTANDTRSDILKRSGAVRFDHGKRTE
jgi:hypothetical protein